jgi:hypothetical protein
MLGVSQWARSANAAWLFLLTWTLHDAFIQVAPSDFRVFEFGRLFGQTFGVARRCASRSRRRCRSASPCQTSPWISSWTSKTAGRGRRRGCRPAEPSPISTASTVPFTAPPSKIWCETAIRWMGSESLLSLRYSSTSSAGRLPSRLHRRECCFHSAQRRPWSHLVSLSAGQCSCCRAADWTG